MSSVVALSCRKAGWSSFNSKVASDVSMKMCHLPIHQMSSYSTKHKGACWIALSKQNTCAMLDMLHPPPPVHHQAVSWSEGGDARENLGEFGPHVAWYTAYAVLEAGKTRMPLLGGEAALLSAALEPCVVLAAAELGSRSPGTCSMASITLLITIVFC